MTNQQKAEHWGMLTRSGLYVLEGAVPLWSVKRDIFVNQARQAGHWGRLALAETDEDEVYFREQERRWLASWGQIIKTSIDRGLAAQAGGDATIAFHRAGLYLTQATGFGDYR